MFTSSRRSPDDADVIRARLRLLLDEGRGTAGWLPEDDDPSLITVLPVLPVIPAPLPGQDEVVDEAGTVPVPADARTAGVPAGVGRHRSPGSEPRLDPGRRGARTLWAVALAAALVVAGWSWLSRPEVDPVGAGPVVDPVTAVAGVTSAAVAAATDSGTVVVSVVGLVAAPGLVTLPAGARVADAIAAAGGLLPGADPASVNAAALLTDGEQIAVGVPGATPAADSTAGGAGTGQLLDLNTATASDLDTLPGIGPVLAQRIVDFRTTNGPFTSVEQLDDVSGIGPAVFAQLAQLVTV